VRASAAELTQLQPGLWIWQAHDSSVRADLFSTAVASHGGIYVVDPIPLAESQLQALLQTGTIAAVILTNANHQRAALDYSNRFSVPIFAHSGTLATIKAKRSAELSQSVSVANELQVIPIDGAVAGEIALYHRLGGGTLILGDALINFEPYGFTFLPRKYCLSEKEMHSSLCKLLSLPVERILFAHGTPILSGAGARLRVLLGVDSSKSR
jgi:Metallo-beta-lactamase superfamily